MKKERGADETPADPGSSTVQAQPDLACQPSWPPLYTVSYVTGPGGTLGTEKETGSAIPVYNLKPLTHRGECESVGGLSGLVSPHPVRVRTELCTVGGAVEPAKQKRVQKFNLEPCMETADVSRMSRAG